MTTFNHNYFKNHQLNNFHPTKKGTRVGDATIIFTKPFIRGLITSHEMFETSQIQVKGLRTEGKLFGYLFKIPKTYKHRTIGGSLFCAATLPNIETPNEVQSIFTGNNFSIFIDDLEQAVACVSSVPNLVDVSKG